MEKPGTTDFLTEKLLFLGFSLGGCVRGLQFPGRDPQVLIIRVVEVKADVLCPCWFQSALSTHHICHARGIHVPKSVQ